MTDKQSAEIEHGTPRGYYRDKCRCADCRAAQHKQREDKNEAAHVRLTEIVDELIAEGCLCAPDYQRGKGFRLTRIRPGCPVHGLVTRPEGER